MQVNFRASTPVLNSAKLMTFRAEEPPKPVEIETAPAKKLETEPQKQGLFNKSRETWKSILKTWASIKSYSKGFGNGLKNAVIAGGALIGLDWMVTSGIHVSNGKSKISEVLATPFVLVGKTLAKGGKFICGGGGRKNIFARPVGETLKMAVWEAPKKAFNALQNAKNVSRVAKWGMPILAIGTLGYTTFISCLNANRAHADIDHAYGGEVGHH